MYNGDLWPADRQIRYAVSFAKTRLYILILLFIFFAQLLSAAVSLSATVDEGFHITSGYEYLRTGRVQLFDEHPPLAKALFAWPLWLIHDLLPPEEAPGYTEGDLITAAQATVLAYQPIERAIVACRIPVSLLCVLLACSVYRWAGKIGGVNGGLLALVLFTFDPNILAHGSLATTDLGSTAFIFWTLLALYAYMRAPTRRRWWMVAIVLGLAQLTKLTAIALFPVCGILILAHAWLHAPDHQWRALSRAALSYAGMISIAVLIVWAGYGFEVRPISAIANGTLPIPAASHIERWERLRVNLTYGRESFLLGQNRMHGWWQYFPITFLLKTPLPVLILAGWAILRCTLARANVQTFKRANVGALARRMLPGLSLLLFPVLYAASSLTSSINIGYRHLLPLLPFMYVGIGAIADKKLEVRSEKLERSNKDHVLRIAHHQFSIFQDALRMTHYALRFILCALLAWLIIGTLALSPSYLTFFNEIASGPDNGWRFLADSNTDWGQTLKALAAYQKEQQTGPVKLSVFTFLDPATYDVDYVPIAPMKGVATILPQRFNPEPGLYAISATTLDGVPLAYPATYDWFRHREPMAQVAHAMHIYRVSADETHDWIAQCTTPVVPLDDQAIAEGFGISELHTIVFDCEQSWIVPAGNGWYARTTPNIDRLYWPRDTEHLDRWPEWTRALSHTTLHLSYEQRQPGTLPAFTIWEYKTGAVLPENPVDPVDFEATLTFLGFTAPATAKAGDTVDVLTYWRALTSPARPLSLMLHLVEPGGNTVAVGDGLGVAIDQWRAGDLIVQRHAIAVPSASCAETCNLVGGAYWLDTMQRLRTPEGDTLFLASIDVKR
jgi:4-amino-4-deoxy-L-arabinose transferase-like glycosyltransferase